MILKLCFIDIGLCLLLSVATSCAVGNGQIPSLVPVAQLRAASQQLVREDYITEFPVWVNRTLLVMGQKFLRKYLNKWNLNVFSQSIGLGQVLMEPWIDAPKTGVNVHEINKTCRRYYQRQPNIEYWANADLESAQGPDDFLASFKNEKHVSVRWLEESQEICSLPLTVPSHLLPDPGVYEKIWLAFEKDLRDSTSRAARKRSISPSPNAGAALPGLNQFTLVTQLWAYVAPPMLFEKGGLLEGATNEKLLAYLHFWAFIGRAMGIREEYNICIQPNKREARRYFKKVLDQYVTQPLLKSESDFKVGIEVGANAWMRSFGLVGLAFTFHVICEKVLYINCDSLATAQDNDPGIKAAQMMMIYLMMGKNQTILGPLDRLLRQTVNSVKLNY